MLSENNSKREPDIEMKKVVLRVENICKNFGPTKALTDVTMEFYGGEICGLIGENGSGKSTLSSIIAGIQPATSGIMYKFGERYIPENPVDGQKKGVAMIVQEAGTIPNISITDNIFAGKEKYFMKGPFVNKKAMNQAARKALEKIGAVRMNPSDSLNVLSQEDKKIVEIARALDDDPDLLIVDETTTALSVYGRDIIYANMRKMRDEGKAVIIISHDIDEILAQCDSVVVLRDGIKVGRLEKEEMNGKTIRNMMVGREMTENYYREDEDGSFSDEVVLEANDINTEKTLKGVSLQLHKGEILGIGGLTESGMHDLGRILYGIDQPIKGEVILKNGKEDYRIVNPWGSVRHGIGYVSKNRDVEALLLTTTIRNNITLASLKRISRMGFVSGSREVPMVQEEIDRLSIKCGSMYSNVNSLSGGNKQKVVFGKWLATGADVLILDCPTRGVDIGVKSAMYSLIEELKNAGKSIIMISEELAELIGMSDRILIMKDGQFTKEFPRDPSLKEHDIIHYMI